ncbi:unnamed protein product [Clonostachys rosea f. rosea IK726]|uniref:Uncharacterized protein n=1 Tax=Clonostachys rosea f. rosea IK726 TaxID=1349383 RepID=A0ACA9UMQ0_BIOOC|nr:unnamed protein product [Clonostachys rosea f. rosea IK726]
MVPAELCPPIVHADTPPPCDGEELSGPGASQDTTIVIFEDGDAEDEGYGRDDSHSPQSYTTTATSIAIHFNSMGTKQLNRGGCRNHYGNYATESQVGVEGDSIRVYGSHLDPSADPEPNVQTLCQTNSASAGDVDFDSLPTNTKSQTMLDEQPIIEATPAIPASSEPVAMTADEGPGEKSGNYLQNNSVTPQGAHTVPWLPLPR